MPFTKFVCNTKLERLMDNVNLTLTPFSESQLEFKFKKWMGEILDERLPTITGDLNTKSNDDQRFITAKKFCKRTETALQSFYNKAPNGEIPGATRYGRKWFVDMDVFEKHLKDNAVPA